MRLATLALFASLIVASAAQPRLTTLRASWDAYPLSLYPGGSNAVITLYKSTSLGTVWSPFKPTSVTPAARTNQTIVVVTPNKFRFYATATVQPYGESDPSDTVTNDFTTASFAISFSTPKP